MAPQNSAFIQQLFRGAERGPCLRLFRGDGRHLLRLRSPPRRHDPRLADGQQGWRWIFYVNVPIGILAVLLGRPTAAPKPAVRTEARGRTRRAASRTRRSRPHVSAGPGGGRRVDSPVVDVPVGASILTVFVRWQYRLVARGTKPLLDPRLFTTVRGYAVGAGVGTLYFIGFSGVWLVFALFYQNGLAFSPLQSGLAVTPFALGSAGRGGRGPTGGPVRTLLTVCGLVGVICGLGGAALLLRFAPVGIAPWIAAPVLFLGGIGGGFVVSPNITMTLRDVPVDMAGAAGGALQTGQRLGAAVGTAALPGLFYMVLADGDDYQGALVIALGTAIAGMVTSLALAVFDWRRDRRIRGMHGKCTEEVANSPMHSRQS
ncbi:MFS transporter [Streptomyces sp. PAN_FS17]|uniref:MFS transporter n=1 Tax=Streptomyces sp. PAN_FS17 TaxID=1855351 RepID=UPI00210EAE40|nr:MFS transporter [Streptomyces sp. PAN_FS17]